ncbi:MAG: peptide chain release factor N(5)-glutamine methyltransferase [Pseudolabrys sp.]
MLAATRTIAEARQALTEQFRHAGIDSAEADVRLLMAHALGIDRTGLVTGGERALSAEGREAIDALAMRRLRHEPVSRILGQKEFWTLSLTITPDVLVPRPETETVIEAARDALMALKLEKLRILDIGTGSGALLLALLREFSHAIGTGTDISEKAIEVARANAARNELAGRCSFVTCDIAAGVQGPFDLIVSNPPYVARGDIATLTPEVRDYDPLPALDGGVDGLDSYRAIAAQMRPLLAQGGRLVVELGAGQEGAVRALFTKAGFNIASVKDDLAGIPRALSATAAP